MEGIPGGDHDPASILSRIRVNANATSVSLAVLGKNVCLYRGWICASNAYFDRPTTASRLIRGSLAL